MIFRVCLADPGKARGCFTITVVTYSLIEDALFGTTLDTPNLVNLCIYILIYRGLIILYTIQGQFKYGSAVLSLESKLQ